MGDMADGMINDDFCEICGIWLGEGDGYPRTCDGCTEEETQEAEEATR